jgi:nucleoside 2-deoxyribosyltransferase
MYYIAAPIFKPEHITTVKAIEDLLDRLGKKYFSPREYGVIANEAMTPERMERIYDMNILMLIQCDIMIAVIDDKDAGTVFEMGFFAAKQVEYYPQERHLIITYSANDHGVNVMLKHATGAHCKNMKQLNLAIEGEGHVDLEVLE